jgi:hypothetical protein
MDMLCRDCVAAKKADLSFCNSSLCGLYGHTKMADLMAQINSWIPNCDLAKLGC